MFRPLVLLLPLLLSLLPPLPLPLSPSLFLPLALPCLLLLYPAMHTGRCSWGMRMGRQRMGKRRQCICMGQKRMGKGRQYVGVRHALYPSRHPLSLCSFHQLPTGSVPLAPQSGWLRSETVTRGERGCLQGTGLPHGQTRDS